MRAGEGLEREIAGLADRSTHELPLAWREFHRAGPSGQGIGIAARRFFDRVRDDPLDGRAIAFGHPALPCCGPCGANTPRNPPLPTAAGRLWLSAPARLCPCDFLFFCADPLATTDTT